MSYKYTGDQFERIRPIGTFEYAVLFSLRISTEQSDWQKQTLRPGRHTLMTLRPGWQVQCAGSCLQYRITYALRTLWLPTILTFGTPTILTYNAPTILSCNMYVFNTQNCELKYVEIQNCNITLLTLFWRLAGQIQVPAILTPCWADDTNSPIPTITTLSPQHGIHTAIPTSRQD